MKKAQIYKILFVIVTVCVALLLIYFAFLETIPELIPIIEAGDTRGIQDYLQENSDFKGVLCAILIQMVQVWSIFIPGMPIQIATGAVYGLAAGFVICHLSSVVANYLAFVLWKKGGEKLEKFMPSDSGSNSKLATLLSDDLPPAYVVILACMVPILPNGFIPLLAAQFDISPKRYTFSVWIGSFLNVLLCCGVGDRIINGDWLAAVIMVLILLAALLLMWFFRKKVLCLYNRIRSNMIRRVKLKKEGSI